MFKRNIAISSHDEARRALNVFTTELAQSDVPPHTAKFLTEQIESTLIQFERQLGTGPIHRVDADRLFEGDGYKVTIRVRSGGSGSLDKLRRLLGIGQRGLKT